MSSPLRSSTSTSGASGSSAVGSDEIVRSRSASRSRWMRSHSSRSDLDQHMLTSSWSCELSRAYASPMVPEAPLERTETGLVPKGEVGFVVNARDARWQDSDFGPFTRFEGDVRFRQIGINIGVLEPGQPSCMYHREDEQEDFLVLSGECLLLIEGEERRLKAWDFVHCPAWTE